ncbi:MAG TPA: hypothetical protein VE973_03435 [Candidatus Limnocylindria bacterium]|nr:hypothetical protein [Candidatus Limnocylindria bacterium]
MESTVSFDLTKFDPKRDPNVFSYVKREIQPAPLFLWGIILILFGIYFYTQKPGPLVIAGIVFCVFAADRVNYLYNKRITYVVDQLYVTKFFGPNQKWKIEILSITDIGSGIVRQRNQPALERGYIIKANNKFFKIPYDLMGVQSFTTLLKSVNPAIAVAENYFGFLGNYGGNKLTREYFWRGIWQDVVIILAVLGIIIFAVVKFSS